MPNQASDSLHIFVQPLSTFANDRDELRDSSAAGFLIPPKYTRRIQFENFGHHKNLSRNSMSGSFFPIDIRSPACFSLHELHRECEELFA